MCGPQISVLTAKSMSYLQDAVVAEVTGNGDVAKVENGDVKPEVVVRCDAPMIGKYCN